MIDTRELIIVEKTIENSNLSNEVFEAKIKSNLFFSVAIGVIVISAIFIHFQQLRYEQDRKIDNS